MLVSFRGNVDYAMLNKIYGRDKREPEHEARYSPAACIGVDREVILGNPDQKHISTSYIERQNLTMRMNMRRFTRLTNAFSKKVENLCCAVALHFMYYNFCRVHQTLKTTPAIATGVADRVWTVADIVQMLSSK